VAAAAIAVGALAGAGWAQPILPLPVHVGALHLANTCFALLAAKGPQTNWGRPVRSPLVAVRGRLARYLFLSHTWHLEHHLYPDIPMPYLGLVAERIDQQLAREGAITVVTW
jgi:beta-carotene hydroxylase